MARLLTNDKLTVEYGKRFATRPYKGRTGVSPTIGFEFEIPLNAQELHDRGYLDYPDEAYDSDYYNECPLDAPRSVPMSQQWLADRGFKTHLECGGQEVCSPIHLQIEQARATARGLLDTAYKTWWLEPDAAPDDGRFCGIHVHAGTRLTYQLNENFNSFVFAIMNRRSASRFIWALSGRTSGTEYAGQAESDEWDTQGDNAWLEHNAMVQSNGADGCYTLEYRFFAGLADRLIPAIDFTHSFTKWARPLWERSGLTKMDLFREGSSNWGHEIPTVQMYKEWLDKQPGYAALKSDHALSYI